MLGIVQDKSLESEWHELPKPREPSSQVSAKTDCAGLPSENVTEKSQTESQVPENSSAVKLTVDPAGAELGLTLRVDAGIVKLVDAHSASGVRQA